MSGANLYDEDGVLRYAPAPKAPVKRSQALISRILRRDTGRIPLAVGRVVEGDIVGVGARPKECGRAGHLRSAPRLFGGQRCRPRPIAPD